MIVVLGSDERRLDDVQVGSRHRHGSVPAAEGETRCNTWHLESGDSGFR